MLSVPDIARCLRLPSADRTHGRPHLADPLPMDAFCFLLPRQAYVDYNSRKCWLYRETAVGCSDVSVESLP